MTTTDFISIQLGSGDTRSTLVVDVHKLCYISYRPETREQTAKLTLDFGASQKMFEKQEAEQVYQALAAHPLLKRSEGTK